MSNATTAPLNDGAMINNEPTPATSTFSITETEQTEFLSALYAAMDIDALSVRGYFESQPVVLATLGMRLQISKDDGERMALNSFINSVRSLNTFVLNILQRRNAYNNLESLVCSLSLVDE